MPKVSSEKRNEKKSSGWNNGQLFDKGKDESSFQGGGFKDKEKALETIRLLDGRDITYQYQIINSMYNRAKVIVKRTTDKEKRQNLSEAIDTFEEWIDDYKTSNKSKENFSYLPVEMIEACKPLAKHYGLKDFGFLEAYTEADGDLKKLRTMKKSENNKTWDVLRNKALKPLATNVKDEYLSLFETDEGKLRGLPTKIHTEMIMWGYSNDMTKLKKCISLIKEKFN